MEQLGPHDRVAPGAFDGNVGKEVPLVIYGPDGARKVIGTSTVNEDLVIESVVTDPEVIEALREAHKIPEGLSIGFDPAGEYHPMAWGTFMRRPFPVEAVEVTKGNFDVIAGMTGERSEKEDGTPFIQTDRTVVPNVNRIYLGFWLTKMDGNLRAYSAKTFSEMFEAP